MQQGSNSELIQACGTQSALYRLPVADVHCMYVEVSHRHVEFTC